MPPIHAPSPTDGMDRFIIRDQREILSILRAVMDSKALVSVYFNPEGNFVLTSILALGQDNLLLDFGADAAFNHRVLLGTNLLVVTQHGRVPVQFGASEVSTSRFMDRPAFAVALPQELLRLQRRDDYRLSAPLVQAPRCFIWLPERGRIEARIIDLSCGGVAIAGLSPDAPVLPGTVFPRCRMELPDVGVLELALEVKNSFEVTLRNGARSLRAGCAFVGAPEKTLSSVQRYIIKVERDLRAKLGSFA